jgi:hypothetical protein
MIVPENNGMDGEAVRAEPPCDLFRVQRGNSVAASELRRRQPVMKLRRVRTVHFVDEVDEFLFQFERAPEL